MSSPERLDLVSFLALNQTSQELFAEMPRKVTSQNPQEKKGKQPLASRLGKRVVDSSSSLFMADLGQQDKRICKSVVPDTQSADLQCPHCDSMIQRRNLDRHIRDKHHREALRCDQCEYTTPRSDTLKRHVDVLHRREEREAGSPLTSIGQESRADAASTSAQGSTRRSVESETVDFSRTAEPVPAESESSEDSCSEEETAAEVSVVAVKTEVSEGDVDWAKFAALAPPQGFPAMWSSVRGFSVEALEEEVATRRRVCDHIVVAYQHLGVLRKRLRGGS